jgi:hypothetical protein
MLAFGALISCHQAYSSDLVESPAGGASPSAADFILASYLFIPFSFFDIFAGICNNIVSVVRL